MKQISKAPDILNVKPIGYIRTNMPLKFDAPHQPDNKVKIESTIELVSGLNFEQALKDLAGFERIWLIWWFHRNTSWRPMVLPPRGNGKRRGVLATRSPHRPNPIGLTSVPLIAISGRKLSIGSNDLIDGTPILDIKPYISAVDSFDNMKSGWLDELESELGQAPKYSIELSDSAKQQADWLLSTWKIDFISRAKTILERDPTPHRTRRITRSVTQNSVDSEDEQLYRIGCGAWRIFFTVRGDLVELKRIAPGYPERLLNSDESTSVPHKEAQLEFLKLWPKQ